MPRASPHAQEDHRMHHRLSVTLATAAAAALTGGLLAIATAPASAAGAAKAYDFNGDGYRDLAIGVKSGTAGGKKGAGYIAVVPGSAKGPKTSARYTVSQSTSGIPGTSETDDFFGSRITSADLDSDGYADLVVTAPGEDASTSEDTGRITILWSGPQGFTRGTVLKGSTLYDGTGFAGLAVADVNGDGKSDIVTANRGDETSGVSVARGPFAPGTTPAALTYVTGAGIPHFTGYIRLAVGDIDGDGRSDVAAAYNGLEGGGTTYLRGTSTGLVRADSWYGETTGNTVAVGDFDKDGYADLALGNAAFGAYDSEEPWVPQHPLPTRKGGAVRVLYGSAQGPAATRPPVDLVQGIGGVPGTDETDDRFGNTLSTADVNGDGAADLAIGAPGEDIGSAVNTGNVVVLHGSGSGLTTTGAQSFNQGTAGVPGSNETDDSFGGTNGYGIFLRDLNRDGRADLSVAAPGEDGNNGRVWTLTAGASGPTGTGAVSFTAGTLALPAPTTGLAFGSVLGY
ncbi:MULTISPECIES: FG-GAP and VCBS repeat-containing protein [unclassified Streptomyces]|uniref:FG-GAP and VCBS repeat-containing protein n=1 Tax=unclassified Streptomyces TaxID=2593676 RepID=UPI002253FF56|nr:MULTISPECIES: FG-GAP and VCBS repeat-containing protein [unclassified Streptomyces]MCX4989677.1 VCBS repeat-containing protein [Streptomyces sp. NBC_00568]MCX5005083.1 VCBS repeat-containing protein [Streptomyces sp. NBC_00638]